MSTTTATKRFNAFDKAGVQIPKNRSTFNLSHRRLDTFNYGELIPIYVEDVIPGDTISIKQSHVIRLTTLVKPLMDNLVYDTYYFYVPYRLLQTKNINLFKNLMGEKTNDFSQNTNYQELIKFKNAVPSEIVKSHSLLEKLGAIVGTKSPINNMYIEAYKSIYNDFFRDEDIQELEITDGDILTNKDNEVNEVYTSNQNINDKHNARILYANKFKDYFTTAKQYSQSGNIEKFTFLSNKLQKNANIQTKTEKRNVKTPIVLNDGETSLLAIRGQSGYRPAALATINVSDEANIKEGALNYIDTIPERITIELEPGDFNDISINELRANFALQNFKENNYRLGNRYNEKLYWYWQQNINNDLILAPEYIGGMRSNIAIQQVAQTSETSAESAQGTLTAYSQTNDIKNITTKTCKEFGLIMGIGVLRLNGHTYSQGVRKQLNKIDYMSLIWKEFQNLGLQPVYNKELYYNENEKDKNDKIFGYQEIYNEYRYRNNEAHGEFTETDNTNFNYALTDYYTNTPILNQDYLKEDPSQLDRVLIINHDKLDQVTADFYFNVTVNRQLVTYSVPSKLF